MDERRLNYFNYNTEVEDTFVRRRGKHLFISNIDWALIETWKQMGVPLHIALRGIEKSFDSWEAKPRKRSVKTLLYCQEEVEAQYAEWLETRVGSHEDTPADGGEDAKSPFPREVVIGHLARWREALAELAEGRNQTADELSERLMRPV